MVQRRQDYITLSPDGVLLSEKEESTSTIPVQQGADVVYSLERIAAEEQNTAPAVLVMARAKTARRLFPAVVEAGFSLCAPQTQDHRLDSYLKMAHQKVNLGEKYSEGLFSNAYAVLMGAKQCHARFILLADEAVALAEVDSFLARAAACGIEVFRPLSDEAPLLGWLRATTKHPATDEGDWRACSGCGLNFDESSLAAEHYVCPTCGTYLRMSSAERIDDLLDAESFYEWNRCVPETDPLAFPGYIDKLQAQREKSGLDEAIRTGVGTIAGLPVALGFMESQFFMGSMGSVVGEKVARLVERATDERLPVVIFTASGGARMQEGLISLMQMAKVSCALERHAAAHLPYFAVLTDPTTGGVTASFAMQGDIILAEPRALIGFAGQRVIKDTIKQDLPVGFQTAEFALEHGLIDAIVTRDELRSTLAHLLALHLFTAPLPFEGSGRGSGECELIVSYEAVCSNLKNGSGTYNTVTYGELTPEGSPVSDQLGWGPSRLRSFVSDMVGRRSRLEESSRKRLEQVMAHGGFDAEGGISLEVNGSPITSAEQASQPGSTSLAWESVQIARNVHRPTAQFYLDTFVEGFIELHGDRSFGDDGAIVAGVGWVNGHAITIIAQEKGVDLKERIRRNFGCPQPEGYRKSLRLMRQAEKFGRPILCLVDTQGAFCGTEAEQRGQGNAIAENLIALAGLRVPVISVILGEGGSGGALALALADRVAMQKHAVYSVLSPEGFASILWKDRTRAPEAAAVMKMDAREVCQMGIVDTVLSEGDGPAHENPDQAAAALKKYVTQALKDLGSVPTNELLGARYERFMKF